MALTNFYRGTTKNFSGTISYNAAAPDISSDTVTFMMKVNKDDTDANALISTTANVTTSGATGIYSVALSNTDTDVSLGLANYEIVWDLSTGDEYVLEQGTVSVLERVDDV